MVWDLRGALLKKEEFETARLLDFEFRQRARAMKLLAAELGMEPAVLVGRIALQDDAAILVGLCQEVGRPSEALAALWADCWARARKALIAERGDPTPTRLG